MIKKIKKFFNLIISLVVLLFSAGMIISLLDFFDVIELPEKISLKHYLIEKDEVLLVSGDDSLVENNIRDKVIVVDTKDTTEYDYESIYGEEYLESLKNLNNNQNNNNGNSYDEGEEVDETTAVIAAREFYYNQLPDEAQQMYIALYNNKEKLRTGLFTVDFGLQFNDVLNSEGGEKIIADAFQLSINALSFDNPEIFYINPVKMFLLTEITSYPNGKTEYRVTIGANNGESYLSPDFYSKEMVDAEIDKLNNLRGWIIEETKNLSTKEKIRYVHDYLVDTVSYDRTVSKDNIYNIYGALNNGVSVCEGYARAFKYILDGMEIPCIIAVGVGTNNAGESEDHAWNYVRIAGRWYAVDVTWDDPIILGGGEITDDIRYKYFLTGRDPFFNSHFEDGYIIGNSHQFKYPTINLVEY